MPARLDRVTAWETIVAAVGGLLLGLGLGLSIGRRTAAPAAGASQTIQNGGTAAIGAGVPTNVQLTQGNGPTIVNGTGVIAIVNGAALPAAPALCNGLFHLDPFGNILVGAFDVAANCFPALQRDVPNNVLTTNHNVCLVDSQGPTRLQPFQLRSAEPKAA